MYVRAGWTLLPLSPSPTVRKTSSWSSWVGPVVESPSFALTWAPPTFSTLKSSTPWATQHPPTTCSASSTQSTKSKTNRATKTMGEQSLKTEKTILNASSELHRREAVSHGRWRCKEGIENLKSPISNLWVWKGIWNSWFLVFKSQVK